MTNFGREFSDAAMGTPIVAQKLYAAAEEFLPSGFDFDDLKLVDSRNASGILWSNALAPFYLELIKTRSYEEFGQLRGQKLAELTKLVEDAYNDQDIIGEVFKRSYDDRLILEWVFQVSGVILPKEVAAIWDVCGGEKPIRQKIRVVKAEVLLSQNSQLPSEKKVLPTLAQARKKISALRAEGLGVFAGWGTWDIRHRNHEEFLSLTKSLGGKFGRLVVCVPEDREVAYFKGAKRPIFPQDDRVMGIASLACVDYVIPTRIPARKLTEKIIRGYYDRMHKTLGAHFRVIGFRDDDHFELYEHQCQAAGMGLLYARESKNDQLISTTKLIKIILERYKDGE